jgi:hypothetical protein
MKRACVNTWPTKSNSKQKHSSANNMNVNTRFPHFCKILSLKIRFLISQNLETANLPTRQLEHGAKQEDESSKTNQLRESVSIGGPSPSHCNVSKIFILSDLVDDHKGNSQY